MGLPLRLILLSILNCRFENLLALAGVVCSTWVAVNAGTSQRDVLSPMGCITYPSVSAANRMVSRTQGLIKLWYARFPNFDRGIHLDLS